MLPAAPADVFDDDGLSPGTPRIFSARESGPGVSVGAARRGNGTIMVDRMRPDRFGRDCGWPAHDRRARFATIAGQQFAHAVSPPDGSACKRLLVYFSSYNLGFQTSPSTLAPALL